MGWDGAESCFDGAGGIRGVLDPQPARERWIGGSEAKMRGGGRQAHESRLPQHSLSPFVMDLGGREGELGPPEMDLAPGTLRSVRAPCPAPVPALL